MAGRRLRRPGRWPRRGRRPRRSRSPRLARRRSPRLPGRGVIGRSVAGRSVVACGIRGSRLFFVRINHVTHPRYRLRHVAAACRRRRHCRRAGGRRDASGTGPAGLPIPAPASRARCRIAGRHRDGTSILAASSGSVAHVTVDWATSPVIRGRGQRRHRRVQEQPRHGGEQQHGQQGANGVEPHDGDQLAGAAPDPVGGARQRQPGARQRRAAAHPRLLPQPAHGRRALRAGKARLQVDHGTSARVLGSRVHPRRQVLVPDTDHDSSPSTRVHGLSPHAPADKGPRPLTRLTCANLTQQSPIVTQVRELRQAGHAGRTRRKCD